MSGCATGAHTHGHRSEGRFRRHRVNCEQVPFLPAWAVAWVLDDPRKIPYLFVWKRPEDVPCERLSGPSHIASGPANSL